MFNGYRVDFTKQKNSTDLWHNNRNTDNTAELHP